MRPELTAGRRLLLLLVGLVFLAPPIACGQTHQEARPRPLDPIPVAGPFRDRGDGVLWAARVTVPRAHYLRLHFADVRVPAGLAFEVVIRNAAGRAVLRYTAEEFVRTPSFYTDLVYSDTALVEVQGTLPLTGLGFAIDHVLHEVPLRDRAEPQSTVPRWRDAATVPARLLPALPGPREAVAKLFIGSGVVCSGFAVGPRALLTNYHCLRESAVYAATRDRRPAACSDVAVHFDFDRQPQPDTVARAVCLSVTDASEDLDYALLELSDPAPAGGRARRHLVLSDQVLTGDEEVFVVHHPVGLAKKVSFGCLAYAGGPRIEHDCDTSGGSSGAPVVTRDGRVVGLHHEGAYPRELTAEQVEELIGRGQVFRNKAQPAHLIRERLRGLLP
jgi:hypothetical protein